MKEDIIGLIPAAGKGVRLNLPYPKELFPIIHNNKYKPVSQYIFENMLTSGVKHVVFVINESKHQLIGYYGNGQRFKDVNVSYVAQEYLDHKNRSTSPGLADALNSAYHLIKGKTDAYYLKLARMFALLAGGIMIGGALLLSITETKTLEHTALVLASIIISGRLGLYLLGFFTTIGDARAVWTGLAFSFLFTLWSVLSENNILPEFLTVPFDLYYTGIIGNIIMFLVGFFTAVLIPAKKRDLTNLSIWTQDGTPLQ